MPRRKRKPHVSTLPNEPIGMLADGSINIVAIDDPPFQPQVINRQGEPINRDLVDADIVRERRCCNGIDPD